MIKEKGITQCIDLNESKGVQRGLLFKELFHFIIKRNKKDCPIHKILYWICSLYDKKRMQNKRGGIIGYYESQFI
jgi:hypothetical protein